jgi:hypothetical protein
MAHKTIAAKILFCGAIILFLFPNLAHAYIDPGTGSYIFQIAGASLLGGMFFVKSAFRSAKAFLYRHFARKAR